MHQYNSWCKSVPLQKGPLYWSAHVKMPFPCKSDLFYKYFTMPFLTSGVNTIIHAALFLAENCFLKSIYLPRDCILHFSLYKLGIWDTEKQVQRYKMMIWALLKGSWAPKAERGYHQFTYSHFSSGTDKTGISG